MNKVFIILFKKMKIKVYNNNINLIKKSIINLPTPLNINIIVLWLMDNMYID